MSTIGALFSNLHTTSPRQLSGFRPDETAQTFAADVIRRAVATPKPEAISDATAEALPAETIADNTALKNREKLENALADSVSYIAGKFGDKAGTAMMALVYKRIGNNAVDETLLGNALLDVTRFVDANFGINEGDNFIRHLNSDLNKSMNAWFDNGKNEKFMAVTMPMSETSAAIAIETSPDEAAPTDAIANAVQTLLESATALRQKKPGPLDKYLTTLHDATTSLPTGVLANAIA